MKVRLVKHAVACRNVKALVLKSMEELGRLLALLITMQAREIERLYP